MFCIGHPCRKKTLGIFSAKGGCSHCGKVFPGGFGEKRNYGGFQDRDQWPKRTSQEHRRHAYRVKNCVSESAAEKRASELGYRYTLLFELPYYASVEMCILDPMHNLFLGTAKRSSQNGLRMTLSQRQDWRQFKQGSMRFQFYQILVDGQGTLNQIMEGSQLRIGKTLFCFSQRIASRMYSLISISTIGNLLSFLAIFSVGHA